MQPQITQKSWYKICIYFYDSKVYKNLATDLHRLNTDIINLLYEKITKSIIGATFNVYNELGYGFLEKVYQRALQVELIQRGHQAAAQVK